MTDCKCLDCVLERITDEVCETPNDFIPCPCCTCRRLPAALASNDVEKFIESHDGDRRAPSAYTRSLRLMLYLRHPTEKQAKGLVARCTKDPDRIPYKETPVQEKIAEVVMLRGDLLGQLLLGSTRLTSLVTALAAAQEPAKPPEVPPRDEEPETDPEMPDLEDVDSDDDDLPAFLKGVCAVCGVDYGDVAHSCGSKEWLKREAKNDDDQPRTASDSEVDYN